MRRLRRLVFHNWPLKLGAIAFAFLLYIGLVVSSSAQFFEGSVPIETTGLSSEVTILSDLGAVRQIRYFVPEDLGLRLDSSSFRAIVDLSDVAPTGGRTSVTVRVVAVDPRVQILDYEPRQITVQLDAVVSRIVPIRVEYGPVPTGLDIGEPTLSATEATVTGAASIVDRISEVQARTNLDVSGIDVNRTIDLVAVDAAGEVLIPVDISPANVRVRVPIFTNRQTRSLPVRPVVIGSPAVGFEIASVTVDPLVVSIEGDVDDIAPLEFADTSAVTISGASSTVSVDAPLQLPDGVQAPGVATVKVTVALRPVTSTRTFEAGLILAGARADRIYALSTDRVLVTIGGSVAELNRLSGSSLALTLDVTGLDVGLHDVKVSANLLTGLTLVGASPNPISVTITLPPPGPSPSPSPSPAP
ncbi:MAG: CdaR family protein [Candidatus Limnocylindrales bacterium]